MLKRAKAHLDHEWCHVAGGLEAGETTRRAALREIAEETASTLDNNARLEKPTSILASAIEMQVSRPLTLMDQTLDAAAACPDRVHHS
jgi:8-oxo-dGTP pyrophosphatase MutT (NUDIX family)